MNVSGVPSLTPDVRQRTPITGALLLIGALLVGCSAPPAAPPRPDTETLRVMTWNVQTGRHDPAEWAAVIARLRPDVLGLQEVCSEEVGELAAVLRREHGLDYAAVPVRPPPGEEDAPINAALGPACDTAPDAVGFGLGVLSRPPIRDARVELFPPDRRDEQRGYQTVRVTTPGGEVLVVNTHVGLEGVQREQLRRLASIGTSADTAIVLGDLNVAAGAPELAPLRRGLVEVDPQGRYPTTARGRIDHVLLRGLAPAGEPAVPETDASDHRPLLTEVTRTQTLPP